MVSGFDIVPQSSVLWLPMLAQTALRKDMPMISDLLCQFAGDMNPGQIARFNFLQRWRTS